MEQMLITSPTELRRFYTDQRIWQGIPSVEVTKKGRTFVTFYSGGIREEIGNYSFIVKSDDGQQFGEPIVTAFCEGHRCFDPCLWIDPLGRLWFTWAVCPDDALYGAICDDPDADTLVWGKEFLIGHNVMMNKPTVLSTGEWLFPIAVWNRGIPAIPLKDNSDQSQMGAFVYKSSDNGKTFHKLGGADVQKRSFDEHMVLELKDGRLMMLVRTFYGIGVAYSYDRGQSWSEGADSGLGGPSSRFHICRLRSGRILLINHVNFTGRNNLTALLSEDDGKTWCAQLLLDERSKVSYPDAKEADDGYIYIVYDRDRGAFKKSIADAVGCAREILMAKITEEDILQGKLVSSGSGLKQVISKLGAYEGKEKNPYKETKLYSDKEFAQLLLDSCKQDEILQRVFDAYAPNCSSLNVDALEQIDNKISAFVEGGYTDASILSDIIASVRVMADGQDAHPMVQRIKSWVEDNMTEDVTLTDMARSLNISRYYMCHLFKKNTGTTILDYRNALRLTKAKNALIHTSRRISDIASDCGFQTSSYFTEVFQESERISPSAYRKLHKINSLG